MKPEIVDRELIFLAGLVFYGDPFHTGTVWTEENEIGLLWKRLEKVVKNIPAGSGPLLRTGTGYEAHIWNDETFTTGLYEVFAGFETASPELLPLDLSIKAFPPGRYARFTLRGREITGDWTAEMTNTWLPANGLKQRGNFIFNLYDSRFKGMDAVDGSEIDVLIPVE